MNKNCIQNIAPEDYRKRGVYTPAKKIDMGNFYQVYVSGVQASKDDSHKVVTEDIGEQTKLIFEDIDRKSVV